MHVRSPVSENTLYDLYHEIPRKFINLVTSWRLEILLSFVKLAVLDHDVLLPIVMPGQLLRFSAFPHLTLFTLLSTLFYDLTLVPTFHLLRFLITILPWFR